MKGGTKMVDNTSSRDTSWQPSFSIVTRLSVTGMDSPLFPTSFTDVAFPPAGLSQ